MCSVCHASRVSSRQDAGCSGVVELCAAVGALDEQGQEHVAVGEVVVQCLHDHLPSVILGEVPSPAAVPVPRVFFFFGYRGKFRPEGGAVRGRSNVSVGIQ